MPARRDDIVVGSSIGRLTVLELLSASGRRGINRTALVRCSCGVEKTVLVGNLRHRQTVSCGCLRKEANPFRNRRHGMSHVPEYCVWSGMKQRCTNPNADHFADYGGRGIKVCIRWLESFENFYADMGARPSAHHSIDRKNVNGDYEPSNCRWATTKEQRINQRPVRESLVNASIEDLLWALDQKKAAA